MKQEKYCDRCAGKTDAAKMIVFKIFKPHQEPLTYYLCRECLVAFAKWMEEEE
jgi:hypothetical protein